MFVRITTILLIFGCLFDIGGCSQAAKIQPTQANAGVDIVPQAVLAAEKITPERVPASNSQPDLIDALSQSPMNHQMILRALRLADMVPQLQNTGPYTLLAPTDEAFSKLPPGTFDRLLQSAQHNQLRNLLQYHLLKGRITFKDMLATNGQVPTLTGQPIIIRGVEGKVTVNDANVLRVDDSATNGIIVWIDGVLLPPS